MSIVRGQNVAVDPEQVAMIAQETTAKVVTVVFKTGTWVNVTPESARELLDLIAPSPKPIT